MKEKFEVRFLDAADRFLEEIGEKAKTKLLYNIKRAKEMNDPAIFKKLDDSLWEFRSRGGGIQYRLIAFWDKKSFERTLVVCCHGFIKKTDKVSLKELRRAHRLRNEYFSGTN